MTTSRPKLARQAAQSQLDAYNAHDIDAFVACYHPEVELFDLESGERRGRGRDEMRETYGPLFAHHPDLHATVTTRSIVGNFAFDHELVVGLTDEPIQAMAIYEVDEAGLITRVWFVRD